MTCTTSPVDIRGADASGASTMMGAMTVPARRLILCACLALVVSGCGSGNDKTAPTTAPSSTASSAPLGAAVTAPVSAPANCVPAPDRQGNVTWLPADFP